MLPDWPFTVNQEIFSVESFVYLNTSLFGQITQEFLLSQVATRQSIEELHAELSAEKAAKKACL